MSKLAVTTAVLEPCTPLIQRCVKSWLAGNEWLTRKNSLDDNLGVTGSLQWLYEHTTAPIIAFLHSDCEIHEPGWDERVLKEFADPTIGVVGFGGAVQLGTDDIYKTPYRLQQLARVGYMSNQTDWPTHGALMTGECDVATLDGFSLIVRRELLDRWRHYAVDRPAYVYGWPAHRYPFHNYDNALCLEAAKQGYRVRLVGVKCTHHGGATATTPAYQEWSLKHLGMTDSEVHTQSHVALYEDGRGWLPLRRGM